MKKLILFNLIILTALFSFSQGDFPVPPGYGSEVAAVFQQRVIDAEGTYLSNTAPHDLDVDHSYGLTPVHQFFPAARKTSVLYGHYPTDGTGDLAVVNAGIKTEVDNSGKLAEIAANIAAFDYTQGVPIGEVMEASTNELPYSVSTGNSDWDKSGATIEGDPNNVVSTVYTSDFSSTTDGWSYLADDETATFTQTGNKVVLDVTIVGTNTQRPRLTKSISSVVDSDVIYLININYTVNSGTCDMTRVYLRGNDNTTVRNLSGSGEVELQLVAGSTDVNMNIYFDGNNTFNLDINSITIKQVNGFPSPHTDATLAVSGFKLAEDDQTSTHYLTKSLTVTNASTVSLSIKAKADERNWIRFEEIEAADGYYFNLETGVIGTAIGTVDAYSINALSDGYWDISITVTVPSTTAEFRIGLADADNSNSYAGDGLSGVKIAFAQLEELLYASTWIYDGTEGSPTSRVEDVFQNATYSGSSVDGVLFMETAAYADDLSDRYVSISDGTAANAVQLYYSTTTNQIVGKVIVGSATQTTLTYSVTDETDFHKYSIRWRVNDFSLWVDGTEQATDVSGVSFIEGVLDEFSLDDGAAGNDAYLKYKEFSMWEYMSDTEMGNKGN